MSPPTGHESDSLSGLDDDTDFDNIIHATPVTDKAGIVSRQRTNALDKTTATFSRIVINAPRD